MEASSLRVPPVSRDRLVVRCVMLPSMPASGSCTDLVLPFLAARRLVRARGEEQKDGPEDEHENRHGRAERDAEDTRNDGECARGTEHGAVGEDAR